MEQRAFPSIKLEKTVPQSIRDNYPLFSEFLKLYYEEYEAEGGGYDFLAHLLQYSDVDETTLDFLENYIQTYLGKLSDDILTDDTTKRTTILNKRTLIKFIRQHYRACGTEKAIKFIINAIYEKSGVEIRYPWDDTITLSESLWKVGIYMKTDPIDSSITGIESSQVIGVDSGAQAIIEVQHNDNYSGYGLISVMELNDYDPINTVDNFIVGEKIKIISYETGEELISEADNITILPILSEVTFTDKGSFYSVKDPVYVDDTGVGVIYRVASIGKGGIDSIDIIEPGTGYEVGDVLTATNLGNFGEGFNAAVHTVDSWGGIATIEIYSHGVNYEVPPEIVISTENGSGAVLAPISDDIGSIEEIEEFDGGVGYTETAVISFDTIFLLSDVVGTFTAAKTVEGVESGATGTIRTFNSDTDVLNISEIISGTFLNGEYIIQKPYGTLTPTLGDDVGIPRVVSGIISEVFYPTSGTDLTLAAEDYTNLSILDINVVPSLDYCINGNFDADTTDWTKGTGWTISLGHAVKVVGAGSSYTNKTLNSRDFTEASWSATGAGYSMTRDEVGIDGVADSATTFDTITSEDGVSSTVSITGGDTMLLEIFLNKNSADDLQLTFDAGAFTAGAPEIRISPDGSVSEIDMTNSAEYKIINYSGNWWRILFKVTSVNTVSAIYEIEGYGIGSRIIDQCEMHINKSIAEVSILPFIETTGTEVSLEESTLDQTIAGLTASTMYECSYDLKAANVGYLRFHISGSSDVEQQINNTEKRYTTKFYADATSETIQFIGIDLDGKLDNVSVTESSEKVKDGDFADPAVWGDSLYWSFAEGSARCYAETDDDLTQASGLTANDTLYLVSFTISENDLNNLGGSFTLAIHGEVTDAFSLAGNYSFVMQSGNTDSNIVISPTSFEGAISGLSIIPATNLVINGTFDNELYGWTNTPDFSTAAGWSRDAVNNWAETDGSQLTFIDLYQTIAAGTDDDYVKITLEVTRDTDNFGDIFLYLDGYPIECEINYDGTTSTTYAYSESASPILTILASPVFSGYVDNVSVKTVTGNGPETLGSERITDPDFSLGTGWTYGTDTAHQDSNNNISQSYWEWVAPGQAYSPGTQLDVLKIGQDITTTANQVYDVSYDVLTAINGKVKFDVTGSSVVIDQYSNLLGTRNCKFRGAGGSEHFDIIADAYFAGLVDNISITPSSDYIINGDFIVDEDAGTTGWTLGSGWSIPNIGYAVADTSSGSLSQTIYNLTSGLNYTITFTLSEVTAGTLAVELNGGIVIDIDHDTDGTFSVEFTATATSHQIDFTGTGFTGKLSDISIVQSEELVADGEFLDTTVSPVYWTVGNWTFNGDGQISISGSGVEEPIVQTGAIPAAAGVYNVEIDVMINSGSLWVNLGDTTGATGDGPEITTNGTHTFCMVSGSDASISIVAAASADVEVYSISVKASESIIANKSFNNDLYWTLGTGWSIGGGIAYHTPGTSQAGDLSQSLVGFTANQPYVLTATLVGDKTGRLIGQNMAEAGPVIGAVNRRTGSWITTKSHLDYDKYIQDSYYYQKFSYVIGLDEDKDEWIDSIDNVHPAGTIVFGNLEEISVIYNISYGGSLGPYVDTFEFYKFDDIESTMDSDFGIWLVEDFADHRLKSFRCPGSQIDLVIT